VAAAPPAGTPGKSYDIPCNSIVNVKLEAGKDGLGSQGTGAGRRQGHALVGDDKLLAKIALITGDAEQSSSSGKVGRRN